MDSSRHWKARLRLAGAYPGASGEISMPSQLGGQEVRDMRGGKRGLPANLVWCKRGTSLVRRNGITVICQLLSNRSHEGAA